ncbi:MAG: hypothetical protein H7257_00415 [Taibaiella sp.]|nr:hypothetical protein [Taibaiella sp.]
MKKLLLIAAMALPLLVNAQIKNVSEMITLGASTFNQVSEKLTKGSWKKYEEGKTDTQNYVRFIPVNMTAENAGDNIMCFYQKKEKPVIYLVLQTMTKKTPDKLLAEAKKQGFKFMAKENSNGQKKDIYSNGKCNISVVEGRQRPGEPLIYLFGVKYP